MTKDELAFVLVKMTGFVVIVGAIFGFFMDPSKFFSCIWQIALGFLIIVKSAAILEFMSLFGEPGSASEGPVDDDTVDSL